ncbi:MAG: hypothetical protein KA419_13350 [Acidobacteria bacterium]|nr:hypothetical protein [Acidobacteriota bacterium]
MVTGGRTAQESVIRRIGIWTLVCAGVGGTVFLAMGKFALALSITLGGVLAWVLYQGQVRIVDRALKKAAGRGAGRSFFLRYLLILLAACAMIRLSIFDVEGFFWGLLLPAAAVMIESVAYLTGLTRGE